MWNTDVWPLGFQVWDFPPFYLDKLLSLILHSGFLRLQDPPELPRPILGQHIDEPGSLQQLDQWQQSS